MPAGHWREDEREARNYERLVECFTDMLDAQRRYAEAEKLVKEPRPHRTGPVVVRAKGQVWVVTHFNSYGIPGLRVEAAEEAR